MTERTLLLIKPDGVRRGLVGEILARVERKGFRIVAAELRTIDQAMAEQHYAEHVGRPYFPPLLELITSGPLLAAVLEGPEVISVWRGLQGATNPAAAAPGTIRGDFATANPANLTHGSDSPESAAREIALFFPNLAD